MLGVFTLVLQLGEILQLGEAYQPLERQNVRILENDSNQLATEVKGEKLDW